MRLFFLSSILIEEARTIVRYFLFMCILKKAKATKKQPKKSKSQESKESKFVVLDISTACFFTSLNVEKISTGLNEL